jgi:NAD(P)-dependent dehydrogenase (short-subunit alcohol dehydrogenase family)
MSGRLDGRVAIVTGAGNGLGRAHALCLAAGGARVVVNDLGGSVHGEGRDLTPAQRVVEEIRHAGGEAVASGHDVADWEQARELVQLAVETFGDLHVLVNNAGILRDRTLANMSEAEWDAVIRVHLKGHAAPAKHAMAYWRERSKAGQEVKGSVVHTSSISGLAGNFGQANYSAAKLGVVALSRVVSLEGARMGVRSNVVSPSARTRLALSTPGIGETVQPPEDPDTFDIYDPANVSPIVAWLAEADCPANSQVFHVFGNRVMVVRVSEIVHDLGTEGRWTPEALDRALDGKLVKQTSIDDFFALMTQAGR